MALCGCVCVCFACEKERVMSKISKKGVTSFEDNKFVYLQMKLRPFLSDKVCVHAFFLSIMSYFYSDFDKTEQIKKRVKFNSLLNEFPSKLGENLSKNELKIVKFLLVMSEISILGKFYIKLSEKLSKVDELIQTQQNEL